MRVTCRQERSEGAPASGTLQSQELALLHRRFAINFGQRIRLQYHRIALTLPQQGLFRITIGITELDCN